MYSNKLVDYFKLEMQEFREEATRFGQDYPKIASELQMSQGKSRDPHIEHLVQSFAWMTSRLRYRLDRSQELIPQILLQRLCPNLISSVPSMSIAEVKVKSDGADFSKGQRLKKHRQVYCHVGNKNQTHNNKQRKNNSAPEVRFRTGFDTTLWPLAIAQVRKLPLNELPEDVFNGVRCETAIELVIEARGNEPLNKLAITELMLYVHGEDTLRWQLVDMLQKNLMRVVLLDDDQKVIKRNAPDSMAMQGFDPEQLLLKQSKNTLPAYDLLLDYFFFPEKFCFFNLSKTFSSAAKLHLT